MEFKHIPIMLQDCIDGLKLKDGGVYFDGTLGGGGHSFEILKGSAPSGILIATDLDSSALQAASQKLQQFSSRYVLVNENFKNFEKVLSDNNIDKLDGILLDLGVSSYQLDERERGFSYMSRDTHLDMRMDKSQTLSAFTVVNEYSHGELLNILYNYGEEKFAKLIVNRIVDRRAAKPINTTGELADIIAESIPKKFQKSGHPAKKTFQAIRIEVNGELDGLSEAIYGLVHRLNKGGRIAIITFHSLEDRIVKRAFNDLETECVCPKTLPVCVCDRKKIIKILNKKPIIADESEILINSRSKSAKLRIAEKI